MKLWIIYKNGIGFSRMIAEMLQDHLDDYIDVSVGNIMKINPSFLVEEKIDYLIIGDVINEEIPSLEIQNWLLKYFEISHKRNHVVKIISGFCVTSTNISVQSLWGKFVENNLKAEVICPPLLHLKLNRANLSLVNGTFDLIRDYINEIINFIINNKKMND